MAKLRTSFSSKINQKAPNLSTLLSSGGLNLKASKSEAQKSLSSSSPDVVSQALNFGTLHSKVSSTVGQSASQWSKILNSASGGASGFLGGGLLATGAFGFVSKLFSLFGGGKPAPVIPTAFQIPQAQRTSLNVTVPESSPFVSVSARSLNPRQTGTGAYSNTSPSNNVNGSQVVQILKQALLTSSTLNDVISEI